MNDTTNKRDTLSIGGEKDSEKARLLASNIELVNALERIHEAVVNHKLNCKEVSANDILLWDTVFSIVDFE